MECCRWWQCANYKYSDLVVGWRYAKWKCAVYWHTRGKRNRRFSARERTMKKWNRLFLVVDRDTATTTTAATGQRWQCSGKCASETPRQRNREQWWRLLFGRILRWRWRGKSVCILKISIYEWKSSSIQVHTIFRSPNDVDDDKKPNVPVAEQTPQQPKENEAHADEGQNWWE